MLRHLRSATLPLLLACFSVPSSAQDYVETFDGGVNAGGWTYGSTIEAIDVSGGNPGAFLHNSLIDTFAPQVRTTVASNPFHGDWRALGVQSFGIDLKTFSTQFPYMREATLMLSNGSCTVYQLGTEFVPQVGAGWASFEFLVDSASTTMPAGWAPLGSCTVPDTAWNNVITNVTEVRLFYGHPEFFYIFDQWNVGMDNARIAGATGTPLCFGDGSGTACPCANDGVAGAGCVNSSGVGAIASGSGGTSVSGDGLVVAGRQIPAGKPALLFVGDSVLAGGAGLPFGDGLRCAGDNIQRLGVRITNSQGRASWGPGLGVQGTWNSGDSRVFQIWYRDNSQAPCSTDFNLSNALSVQFTN